MTSDSSSVRVLTRKTRKAGDDPVPCRSGPSLGRERARRREKSQPPRQEQKTVESYGSTGLKYRAGPWPCSFFVLTAVEASQIPAPTAIKPPIRGNPTGSLTMIAASSEAASGFTVMVLATRVGVVIRSARTQRKNAAAP